MNREDAAMFLCMISGLMPYSPALGALAALSLLAASCVVAHLDAAGYVAPSKVTAESWGQV
jgi:hypothetical protein